MNGTYRPVAAASLPETLGNGIFMGIWSGVFVGLWGTALLGTFGYETAGTGLGIGLAATAFVGTIVLSYYRTTSMTYTVTEDGVEKELGIFSTSITSVRFEAVTDVHYQQSVLDWRFGVGTVKLNTAGSDDTALEIAHVSGARELYEAIEEETAAPEPA